MLTSNGRRCMKVLIVAVMISLLTACSTVAGFGSDITNSANWTKDKMSGK